MAEHCYTHKYKPFMLSVVMLNAIMLCVVMPNVIMLSALEPHNTH
jgi:hypothetical protein